MNYSYKPSGVCAQNISFDIDGDKITNVSFLVDGMTVDEIENKLLGNTCGFKPTSCADQLAKAVRQAYESAKSE